MPHNQHSVRVVIARPGDEEVLHGIAAETFPLACPPGTTAENIRAFIDANLSVEAFQRYLKDANRRLWLAEAESGPIGYAMGILGEPKDPDIAQSVRGRPTAELSKIYVGKDMHGQGVSGLLMTAFIDWATERAAQSVWLGVNQENQRANAFYERSGFEVVGERSFQVGDSLESDFVREKLLGKL